MIRLHAFLLVFSLVASCSSGIKSDSNNLLGRWRVESALRDGQLTETLTEAFFDFRPDGTFTSNINRSEIEYDYVFEDDVILQSGPMNVEYKILKYQPDTMILGAMIRNYDFKFLLIRDTLQVSEEFEKLEL